MCRHAAYVGPGIALTELMSDLDHCLLQQSYEPRELLVGTVCADGYGIGWYDLDTRSEPARYASPLPIWNDTNLGGFGPLVRSSFVMGAVRNATVDGSVNADNCAPFANGALLGSLNGYLDDFDDAWLPRLRDEIDGRAVRGTTDAEWILAWIAQRLEVGLGAAVQSVVRDLLDMGQELGRDAQLNLLIGDGSQLAATRAGNMTRQNSLYLLQDGHEFPDGQVVASEPLYDDPLWELVEESSMIVVQAGAPAVRLRI